MGRQHSYCSETWRGHAAHVANRALAHWLLWGGSVLIIATLAMPLSAAPDQLQISDEQKLYAAAFVVSSAGHCPFLATRQAYTQCMEQVLVEGQEVTDRMEVDLRRIPLGNPRRLRLCDISEKGKIPLADAKWPILWTCLDIPADPSEEDGLSGTLAIGLIDRGEHRQRIRFTSWFPDMSSRIEAE